MRECLEPSKGSTQCSVYRRSMGPWKTPFFFVPLSSFEHESAAQMEITEQTHPGRTRISPINVRTGGEISIIAAGFYFWNESTNRFEDGAFFNRLAWNCFLDL